MKIEIAAVFPQAGSARAFESCIETCVGTRSTLQDMHGDYSHFGRLRTFIFDVNENDRWFVLLVDGLSGTDLKLDAATMMPGRGEAVSAVPDRLRSFVPVNIYFLGYM